MDYASNGDPFATVQLAVAGIAGVVLLLGAVGMLNISMVTVRYRVREIGIRRSLGATSRHGFSSAADGVRFCDSVAEGAGVC